MLTQIILSVATLIITSTATCNLLANPTTYHDTESQIAINTTCAKDANSLSMWEQYQCEYIQNRDSYQKCWPQRRMSTCPPGTLKGAVFLYHGYSACPDQYNDIAPKLQSQCWNVYQILTIGHGYDYCDDNSTINCAGSMYNISFMPIQRQAYIDFTNRMINIITDETNIIKECELEANDQYNTNNLEIAVGGLSFGAPLAAASVVMSGADSIFTKHVLMSPFFGISYKGIDDTIYKCLLNTHEFEQCLPMYFEQIGFDINEDESDDLMNMIMDALTFYVDIDMLDTSFETFNLMIRKTIEWIVENPDAITVPTIKTYIDNTLDTIIGWGTQCELDVIERDRGGFCQFQIRNLAAAHSFGSYIIDLLKTTETDKSVELLIIMVERDGPTRNSLPVNYANLFYDNDATIINSTATDCIWLIDSTCQTSTYSGAIDNTCGVPHSSMSVPDNKGIIPYNLWWNNTYHNGLIDWLNSASQYERNFMVKTRWNEHRDQCVYLDLIDPPDALVADVPQLMTIGLRIVSGSVIGDVQSAILDGISDKTGVPRGVLELSVNVLSNWKNINVDNSNGDYIELEMDLDENSAAVMEIILEYDGIDMFGGQSVEYVKIKGMEYNIGVSSTTTDMPMTTSTTNSGTDSGKVDESTTSSLSTSEYIAKSNEDKKSGSSWYVFLIVLVILLLIIGGIWYCKMKNNNAKNAKDSIGMVKMTNNVKDTGSDGDEQTKMVNKTDDGDGDTKGNENKKETIDVQETEDNDENSDDESSASFIAAGKPTKR